MLLLIEFVLIAAVVVVALVRPGTGSQRFDWIESKFAPLARRRRLAVLLVGLIALAARIAVLPILPVPQPHVDDEFSYLLAADTFAHGRLTNPTPPMAEHFQTLAELVHPTYQSITPPGQGLTLALGEVVFGAPFWGVWLSMGIMCAALCWALQPWVGPEWALLGGLVAVMRWGVFSYWANSYWGGAVAATGGALVFGALPRLRASPKLRDAILMGFGLDVLANSRPYEGLVFSLPVAFALLFWLIKKRGPELRLVLCRVVLPLALLLVAGAVATGYYNWRITGNPLLMPHELYNEVYDPVPPFLGLHLHGEMAPQNPPMRRVLFHDEMFLYRESHSPAGLLAVWMIQTAKMWPFFLGPALSLPLFLAPFTIPRGDHLWTWDWRAKFLLYASLVSIACVAFELYGWPHYAAPMTCLILAVVLLAMKKVRSWRWRGRPSGAFAARGVAAVCLIMFAVRAAAGPLRIPVSPSGVLDWYTSGPARPVISRVRAETNALPGKQLVIVRYGSYLASGIAGLGEPHEWAWNSPNIARQKVIWADETGAAADADLVRHFKGRHVWLLDLGNWPPKLLPYEQVESNRRAGDLSANKRKTTN